MSAAIRRRRKDLPRSIKSPAQSTDGTDPTSKKKFHRIHGASLTSTRAPVTMARTISFPTAPTGGRAATAIIVMLRAGLGKLGFSLLELVLWLLLIRVSMLVVLRNSAMGLE